MKRRDTLAKLLFLPSLQNRRLQDICVLMYKAKNNLCPPYISDIFIKHRSKYNLRQSDFSAARYNTVTYGKHSLRHLGPNLWGKLSPDLREVTTLKCFKNKIRTLDIVTLMDNDASVVISANHRHICHTVNIVDVINFFLSLRLYVNIFLL